MQKAAFLAGTALALALAAQASAEIAVSGNDNKRALVNGVNTVVRDPKPDTLAVIDFANGEPRLVGEVQAPHSVVGPPNSIAVTPDESLALATSAEKIDPSDPSKTVPDNRVSVIDLKASPPRVLDTLEVGAGPSGIALNPAGTMALVANRNGGTVSVLRLAGNRVTPAGTVPIGAATTGVSGIAFTPDGRHALVTRDNDSIVSVLRVEGDTVTKLDRDITAGVRPYSVSVSPAGWAVVGNVGRSANNTADMDTVSLVDVSREPFRTTDTIAVGPTPEGVMASPDGVHAVTVIHNGSSRAPSDPLRAPAMVKLLKVEGGRLRVVAEAPAGDWVQGMAFSRDGRTLLIGNMADRQIGIYRVDGDTLQPIGRSLPVNGGPAALGTAPITAAPQQR
ncbi:lactonase family protein [Roseomonas marmotae]|uniref:YncE family protein n=1 Tax=Roseomonas marmotae TaxID=2768161 RepID=A0ABS3K6Z7_9PROT|nr:YncE family protein [Roseomonas marmotae]MBO1073237.1 YncE family protein [Roseomonas marmotae]QTI79138.1 YncE family protein [Roseomonas marmotae]